MTLESLQFLRDLLGRQQITADAPDLLNLASLIVRIRTELDDEILKQRSAEK